jgi:hypothetical protein
MPFLGAFGACRSLAWAAAVLLSNVAATDAADIHESLSNPVAVISLDNLSVSRERPLFSASRRPPPPPPAVAPVAFVADPPAPPVPPPVLSLYGIITDDNGALAILRPSPTEKIGRVRLGDEVGGWRVSLIESRRLVLSRDDRTATFTLFANGRSSQETEEPRRRRRRSSD